MTHDSQQTPREKVNKVIYSYCRPTLSVIEIGVEFIKRVPISLNPKVRFVRDWRLVYGN